MFEITDWPLLTQLFAVGSVLLYGIALIHFVPRRYEWPLNILISATTIGLCIWFGLTPEALGLGVDSLLRGISIGVAASGVIIGSVYLAARVPHLNPYFTDTPFARMSRRRLGREVAMRIPLSTALLEEVLFRGVLLGLLLQFHHTLIALLLMSICFGLWHIAGAVRQIETQHAVEPLWHASSGRQWTKIASVVIATSSAGFVFGLLRVWSGSLVAPWLVHWAINASGALASRASAARSE